MVASQLIEKITEAEKEALLRAPADGEGGTGTPPTNTSRSSNAAADTTPKPEDVLSKGALAAIRSKGISVDEYYKKLGHDGWDGYFKKHKTYYEEAGVV